MGTTLEVVPGLVEVEMPRSEVAIEVEEIENKSDRRGATVGEKRPEMRGIPGLGSGIINRLADNLRQMGGRVEPYGADAILTPASARILYGL
jgi:hypothetical protein